MAKTSSLSPKKAKAKRNDAVSRSKATSSPVEQPLAHQNQYIVEGQQHQFNHVQRDLPTAYYSWFDVEDTTAYIACSDATTVTTIGVGFAKGLTPMEHWMQQTLKESPWDNIDGVACGSTTERHAGDFAVEGGSTDAGTWVG